MRAALVIAALALAGPAVAQEAARDQDLIVITDTWAGDTCTSEIARPSSFADSQSLPLGEMEPCVMVDGLWDRYFFEGVESYYRLRRARGPAASERLGVYGVRDSIELPDRPVPARLTGRIDDCDRLNGPGVIMVMGYCHYFPGRYIALGHAEITGPPPERWLGAEARTSLGQLLEPPANWPQQLYVEGRARDWLEHVRRDDAAAYADAMGRDPEMSDPSDPDSETHAVFRVPGSVFDRLRQEVAPELRLWRFAPPQLDPDEPPADRADIDVLACFGLGIWTDDRWPVSGVDADNAPQRPYVCIAISRETWNGRTKERIEVPFGGYGLAEPAENPPAGAPS